MFTFEVFLHYKPTLSQIAKEHTIISLIKAFNESFTRTARSVEKVAKAQIEATDSGDGIFGLPRLADHGAKLLNQRVQRLNHLPCNLICLNYWDAV